MRRAFGLIWALVTLAVVGAVGWLAYNAGVADGVATSGHDGTPVNPGYYPYYAHGWGFGFGLFPLLFFILLLFFLFRRPWWGYRHGGGYGGHRGYGRPGSGEGELPPPIEDRMRSWHDRAHGNTPAEPGADPTAGQGQQ